MLEFSIETARDFLGPGLYGAFIGTSRSLFSLSAVAKATSKLSTASRASTFDAVHAITAERPSSVKNFA